MPYREPKSLISVLWLQKMTWSRGGAINRLVLLSCWSFITFAPLSTMNEMQIHATGTKRPV